jgi:hypothetical protein
MPFSSCLRLPTLAVSMMALTLGPIGSATAVSIIPEGSIGLDETVTGVLPRSDNISGSSIRVPEDWDFWTFDGAAGSRERFTVRRLVGELDPVLGIWFGTEADTTAYRDIVSDSVNTNQVALADDELAPAIPGPFGDPTVSFNLPETGTYTVAIAAFVSGPEDKPSGYSLTRSVSVPFSDSATILGSGLVLGLGLLLKRKASSLSQG